MDKAQREHLVKHIDRKLVMRIRMFVIIFLATLIYSIVDAIRFNISIWFVLGAFVVGGLIGIIAGRIQKISFDHDAYKVIGRMDKIGIVVLVLYILIAIGREKLIGDLFHGDIVAVITLAVVAGTMFGRTLTMRYAIRNILKTIGILKE